MIILKAIKELFYPSACLSCGTWLIEEEKGLCLICELELPKTLYKLNTQNPVAKALWGRLPLTFASSYLHLNSNNITHKLVHDIKYRGNKELAIYLGKKAAQDTFNEFNGMEVDCIIPVPLHPKKKAMRGYNQAAEIGKGIASILNKPCTDDLVIRKQFTKTQTKKNREQRWQNVTEIFETKNTNFQNKRVLIVDDVLTTGATIESCALPILNQNPKSISVFTLAFAQG